MDKIKKNETFCCPDCGLEVVVNKACTCIDPELICCGGPMHRGSSSPAPGKRSAVRKSSVK